MPELIRTFEMSDLNKSPARTSFAKLDWFNKQYLLAKISTDDSFMLSLYQNVMNKFYSSSNGAENSSQSVASSSPSPPRQKLTEPIFKRLVHLHKYHVSRAQDLIPEISWYFHPPNYNEGLTDANKPTKTTADVALQLSARLQSHLEASSSRVTSLSIAQVLQEVITTSQNIGRMVEDGNPRTKETVDELTQLVMSRTNCKYGLLMEICRWSLIGRKVKPRRARRMHLVTEYLLNNPDPQTSIYFSGRTSYS